MATRGAWLASGSWSATPGQQRHREQIAEPAAQIDEWQECHLGGMISQWDTAHLAHPATRLVLCRSTRSRFMGPRLDGRGVSPASPPWNGTRKLQWGRGSMAAESHQMPSSVTLIPWGDSSRRRSSFHCRTTCWCRGTATSHASNPRMLGKPGERNNRTGAGPARVTGCLVEKAQQGLPGRASAGGSAERHPALDAGGHQGSRPGPGHPGQHQQLLPSRSMRDSIICVREMQD